MEVNKYSEDFKQSIVSLYNSGKSRTEICKEYGMSSSTLHKWIKKYTEVRVSDNRSFKNLVNQDFEATTPNKIWLSDITYIHTIKHGWTYLASILDVCTRKIVGYHLSKKMNSELVQTALKNATYNQNKPKNIILHSDRGSQYTSNNYTKLATELGMILSYSRKGNPFDNAPIESFHATLKKRKFILGITKSSMMLKLLYLNISKVSTIEIVFILLSGI